MKKKIKGTSAERELLNIFWEKNWVCIRVAGSGSTRYPAPDLIASNGARRLVIEVKYINNVKKYFTKKEIEELIFFGEKFGAESWVAVKFQGIDWYFLNTEELITLEKSFYIDIIISKRKGLSLKEFFELIN